MNIGVHIDHCCKWHGCKYGELQCPVKSKSQKQQFPCEVCDLDWEEYQNFSPEWIQYMTKEKR